MLVFWNKPYEFRISIMDMLATPQTRCYQNVMAKAREGWMGERQAKATTGNKSRLITAFGNNKYYCLS